MEEQKKEWKGIKLTEKNMTEEKKGGRIISWMSH